MNKSVTISANGRKAYEKPLMTVIPMMSQAPLMGGSLYMVINKPGATPQQEDWEWPDEDDEAVEPW